MRRTHPDVARRRRPQLTAQVDPLSGWGRLRDGELLPPSRLTTVLRSLPGRDPTLRLHPLTAADLRRHDQGRTAREPSAALRELLGTLDGERCRFPGCTRHTTLHAHHLVHWAEGGPTDLAKHNLASCYVVTMGVAAARAVPAPSCAAVYARISSDPNDTSLGVTRQVKDCLALAEKKGWTVGEVFTDNDVSATSGRPRPEYERMMAGLAAGRFGALVV